MANLRLILALAIPLAATVMVCLAASEEVLTDDSECQPDALPPLANSSGTMVALQMHQWVWIENLTSPDWAPRTDSGGMLYEFLQPGYVRRGAFLLRTQLSLRLVSINVSYVTNGEALCAAALTQYRNRTTGFPDQVSCSRVCSGNFTTLKTRVQLPLLVYDDWTRMSRSSEYLAIDAVDTESRTAYNCMGYIQHERVAILPSLMSRQKRCREGDQCLFNYDNTRGINFVYAGCKADFSEYSWCVSDVDLCSVNIDGDCPVCCRGELCNKAVAQKIYTRWLEKGAPGSGTASIWTLILFGGVLSLRWLKSEL